MANTCTPRVYIELWEELPFDSLSKVTDIIAVSSRDIESLAAIVFNPYVE